MRRLDKVYIISVCLTICYFVFGTAGLGFRARTDEISPVSDFRLLLNGAQLNQLTYENGVGYQHAAAMLIRVTGTDHFIMQDVSPFIGALALSMVVLAGITAYERSFDRPDLGWLPFAIAPFVFSSALLRLLESSHIAFSFTYMSIGLLVILKSGQFSKVQAVVPIYIVLLAMLVTNSFWMAVYGSILAGAMLLTDSQGTFTTSTVLPYVMVLTIPAYAGWIADIAGVYLRNALATLLGAAAPKGGTSASGKAASRIDLWPTYEILDFTISAWFVYVAGILFVGIVAAVGGVLICETVARKRDLPVVGRLYVVVAGIAGTLLLFFVAIGDAASLKRLLMLPGIFGVLWVCAWLRRCLPRGTFNVSVAAMCVVLLVLAVPATNRFQPNGEGPYDHFADQNQIAKGNWVQEYYSSDVFGTKRVDRYLSGWLGEKLVWEILYRNSEPTRENVIYSSGVGGKLIYDTETERPA